MGKKGISYQNIILICFFIIVSSVNAAEYSQGFRFKPVLLTSECLPQSWRYSIKCPQGDWTAQDYNDAGWETGKGGFGTKGTPGISINTEWNTEQIWLRKEFNLKSTRFVDLQFRLFHDEEIWVYINDKLMLHRTGWTIDYVYLPISQDKMKVFKIGRNVIAVRCKQTYGGQGVDVGIVDIHDYGWSRQNARGKYDQKNCKSSLWRPVKGTMLTLWGKKVTPDNVWQKYPRPQLRREKWTNLNGLWHYAITRKEAERPAKWDGEILVPFAIEASLSGVGKKLEPDQALWYRRTFELPEVPQKRLLMHFEAVDYETVVWLNGKRIGLHVGGNLPFSFDISNYVKSGSNELVLRVFDRTDAGGAYQLRGKQSLRNDGIWYRRVSGIMQTVWLEPVPDRYIENLRINTGIDGRITVAGIFNGRPIDGEQLRVTASFHEEDVADVVGEESVTLKVPAPKLWSPSSPNLYDLKVELLNSDGKVIDSVVSYTGIREVGKVKDSKGHWRFTLNGEILFHWGSLDQGWWPDGLLTPPSEEAMVFDIRFIKKAGFNMIRKHIKVEPRRYYYECDKLGLIVWQDQVSGGPGPEWVQLHKQSGRNNRGRQDLDAVWPDDAHAQWMKEFQGMVDHLWSYPSIVVWTPFNECWGQHRTLEVGEWIANYDPSRLINIASGGNFFQIGDIADEHNYPDPSFPLNNRLYDDYVKVVGEFGGHGWPVKGHLWMKKEKNWGYGGLPRSKREFVGRYRQSIKVLSDLKEKGVAAGVYTQTTDVEGEINGLITYDRKIIKIPAKKLNEIQHMVRLVD